MKKKRLQRGIYFLVLGHFVTGMDASESRARRRLKLKQSSPWWKELAPERTG